MPSFASAYIVPNNDEDAIRVPLFKAPILLGGLSTPFTVPIKNNFSMLSDGYFTYQGSSASAFLVNAQLNLVRANYPFDLYIYIAIDSEVIPGTMQCVGQSRQGLNYAFVSSNYPILLNPKESVSIFYSTNVEDENAYMVSTQLTITQIGA